MELSDPSRRQFGFNSYSTHTGSQQQHTQGVNGGNSNSTDFNAAVAAAANTGHDPYRWKNSSYLQQSPATPSNARGTTDHNAYGGFGLGSQFVPTPSVPSTQYSADLQTHDVQRHDSAQYSQYNAGLMYGYANAPQSMAQPQGSQQQTSLLPFDQISPYRQRSNTAPDALSAPFGVPQTPQYNYHGGQSAPSSAGTTLDLSTQLQAQFSQPSYVSSVPTSTAGPFAGSLMSLADSAVYSAQAAEHALDIFQNQIRAVFTQAYNETLHETHSLFLNLTRYLSDNIEILGLHRDEDGLRNERVMFWDEFNNAWLVALQKQATMTQELVDSTRVLRAPQSILQEDELEGLGSELVKLCDKIEGHGLVDYQMGIAEEQITKLIVRCLHILNPKKYSNGELDNSDITLTSSSDGNR